MLATGCEGASEQSPPVATETRTATETVTATERPSASPRPVATAGGLPALGGDDFGVPWSVEVTQEGGGWCLTAYAEGESQRACGEAVSLDEVHGGREIVSAVEFQVGSLDITAGLVREPVARVRLETAPPPEDPDGGSLEEVAPIDVVVGLNAYADADLDPTPDEPDLPTVRVVALDLTGDEVGETEPAAAEAGR